MQGDVKDGFGDSTDDVMAYVQKRDAEAKEKARAAAAGVTPFGSWPSPITSKSLTEAVVGLADAKFDTNGDLYWIESRPNEAGRSVICKRDAESGSIADLTPVGFNARSKVHEYGGGAFTVCQGVVYFTNFADQRLYAQLAFPGAEPLPLTPEEGQLRFADAVVDTARERLILVVEDHSGDTQHPRNYLAAVSMLGDEGNGFPALTILAEGSDFYASPRLSDDGGKLAWLSWEHPNMPWDGTRLFVAPVTDTGGIGDAALVAGGDTESITSPAFDPFGDLYYVSDISGWWNIYYAAAGGTVCLKAISAEFAGPMWSLGQQAFQFLADGSLLCVVKTPGEAGNTLSILEPLDGSLTPVDLPYTQFGSAAVAPGGGVAVMAASFDKATELLLLDSSTIKEAAFKTVKKSSTEAVSKVYLSKPEAVEFPTDGDRTAWMLYYPPTNGKPSTLNPKP